MRWYVEATKIGGHAPSTTLVVDAEAWPRALQAARAIRGESGPIADFTIELLEDGCRAIEPHGLLTYRVTAAPDDAPLGEVRAPSRLPPRPTPSSPASRPPGSSGASTPPTPSRPAAGTSGVLPSAIVLFERLQEPSAASPLHYREYVFALPPGTSEEVAERVLFVELERLKKEMAPLPSGKLVNLAAFDRIFTGRPSVLPIVTLTWKDWRSEPALDHPLRHGSSAAPMPLSFPPPSPGSGPYVPAPPSSAQGLTADSTIRIPSPPPAPGLDAEPGGYVDAGAADRHLDSLDLPHLAADTAHDALPHDTLPPDALPASAPAPFPPAERDADPAEADGDLDTAGARDGDSQREPRSAGSVASRRSSIPRVVFPRKRADELLSVLFEAMHDLAFLHDAVEGADFCVGLALEQIPAVRGFLHLYDMDRREFVVVAGRGTSAARRLLDRTRDRDSRFHAVMRQAGATVDGESVYAPIVQAGRYIGIVELEGALDHRPFGEAEGQALVYIARQYAEFVAQRGVVIDAARVSEMPRSR